MEYLFYFFIIFILSGLFSMAGTGSGIAVIPILYLFGIPFDLSKAVGLFTGLSATATSTVMNLKRKALDVRFALPLAIAMFIFSPIGAQLSRFVNESLAKGVFIVFLLFSATMMMFFKKQAKANCQKPWILLLLGVFVGLLAGLLGIGGGNLLLPALILLGYEPKRVAVAVSFVVPFSILTSFLSYASFVEMDWILLLAAAFGAVFGGYTGNYLMYFKLSQNQIKKVIAVILYLLAIKMAWAIFF
jgi:uncharacterized membrane protein YfcA